MTPLSPGPIPVAPGASAFGSPAACRFSDLPRRPIDWTNDQERRLEEIERIAAQIEDGIQWLLDRIDQVFSPLLMPIRQLVGDYFDTYTGMFRDRIESYIDLIRRTWEALRPKLEQAARCAGNPAALGEMAAAWRTYETRLTGLSEAVTLEQLATDDRWIGTGATAYATSAQQQQMAISGLAHDASQVGAALEDHAAAILAYDTLMDDATNGFSVAFTVAGIGVVATIAGLIAGGWPGVIAFVLAVIATAASFLSAIWGYFSAVETANALFDQSAVTQETRLTGTAISGSAAWPQFATE